MAFYLRAPEGKDKILTFSYDDGVEQDAHLVALLNAHGMKGTFNVNSGQFAPEGKVYPEGYLHRRMTEAACLALYDGHEVAVHALTHPHLEKMQPEEVVREIWTDRQNLERLFDTQVRGMAYPYGTYNDTVVEILNYCGIAYARTVKDTKKFDIPTDWLRLCPTCRHADPQLMPLAEKFVNADYTGKDAGLFYLWGHTYEFERDDNWQVIEEFIDYMAGRDDVWYTTNMEIYNYVEAWRALRWNTDGTQCENPTATAVWLADKHNTYCIKPGETVKF